MYAWLLCKRCKRLLGLGEGDVVKIDIITGNYDTGYYCHKERHNVNVTTIEICMRN